jgi:hypothetical protein
LQELLELIAKESDLCPQCATPWSQAITTFDGPQSVILQCVSCEEQLLTEKPEEEEEDEDASDE